MRIAYWTLSALSAAVLAGCGNPEEDARAALTEAGQEWTSARAVMDPEDRVAAYSDVIEKVEDIAKDYAETPDGRAIASGVSVIDGLSLQRLKTVRDEFAARAPCYSRPTVACLTPFASNMRDAAADAASSDSAFAAAREAVCKQNLAAADRLLEPFKINRPVYSEELIQVALAAAACNKPNEVAAAIDAYRAASPAQGAARAQSLLSILATGDLRPAWPGVMTELDRGLQSRQFQGQDAAQIALTMAIRHAELGDATAAMAKYTYFTDTLNFQADVNSKMDLAAALIAGGAPEAGIRVVENPNQRSLVVISVARAAGTLGQQANVIADGTFLPQIYNIPSLEAYFAPVPSTDRARLTASVAAVEGELDKLAPTVTINDNAFGSTGMDGAYGILALVHMKLGAADKANAALDKAVAMRRRLMQAMAETTNTQYFAPYRALVALGQGKHAEAAQHIQQVPANHDYIKWLLQAVAKTGKVEDALTMAGQVQPNNQRASYNTIIEALIANGKLDEAEQVIAAFAGNADEKRALQWQLVNKAANDGNPKRAADLAAKYSLINSPRDRLQLLTVSLNNEKTAGDLDDAEPLIREIFTIGQQIDGASGGDNIFNRNENMAAQNAAFYAFRGGHTDLGIELYRAAIRKDQRPLFEAFNDNTDDDDLTKLLVLAHDNLSGAELGYVIDAAIRHLSKEGA